MVELYMSEKIYMIFELENFEKSFVYTTEMCTSYLECYIDICLYLILFNAETYDSEIVMVKNICSFLLLIIVSELTTGLSINDKYTCPRYNRSVDTTSYLCSNIIIKILYIINFLFLFL